MWQKHFNKYENQTKSFNSREKLKIYLEKLLQSINQDREYNVFLHQINDYNDGINNLYGSDAVKCKIFGILDRGFYISRYSALAGTAKIIGSTRDIDVEDILNYNYYGGLDCRAICVVAIPKYVEVDNKLIEYSSFNGQDSWSFPEELTNEYKKTLNYSPELHYFKSCLFDAIKSYKELPKCYMLGVLHMEEKDSKYSFIEEESHLTNLPKDLAEKHLIKVEDKIKNLYKKYQTTDTKKLIVQSYIADQKYYDDLDVLDI